MYRICMSGTDYVSPIENMCIRYKLYMPGTEYVCPVPPEYACPKLIKVCFFFSVNHARKEVHHWILRGCGYYNDSSLNIFILSQTSFG